MKNETNSKQEKAEENQNTKNGNALQAVKFALFSASAGIIQAGSFALLKLITNFSFWNGFVESLPEWLKDFVNSEYGPFYLIALTLSVLWNFTFNRRYTFRSAANIKVAMAKIFGFYLVFTPVSTILGVMATNKGINDFIVLALTMLSNMVLEFLFCKFVVYRNQENTI